MIRQGDAGLLLLNKVTITIINWEKIDICNMKVKGQKRKEGKTYLAGNTLTFGCMAEFR